jgi:diguanylate cyclase (GGDEF)-like protein
MDENILPLNNPALAVHMQVLLSAYATPAGLCDPQGQWLMCSAQLTQQLAVLPHAKHLQSLLATPQQWSEIWRRIQRNREHELPDIVLLPPFQACMLRSRRIDFPAQPMPFFFIECQPRLKYTHAFLGLSRQYQDHARYQHQALMIARRMQMAVTQSLTDPLTQIANRRAFDEALQHFWHISVTGHQPLSVLILDIDFFKDINDHNGHLHGDHVLQQLAQCLANSLSRPNDKVARIGGEEFGIILPNTDSMGAQTVADHLLGAVRRLRLPHPTQKIRPYVTLSMGACSVHPVATDTANSVLHHADLALYKAKATGRDRCCMGSVPVKVDAP